MCSQSSQSTLFHVTLFLHYPVNCFNSMILFPHTPLYCLIIYTLILSLHHYSSPLYVISLHKISISNILTTTSHDTHKLREEKIMRRSCVYATAFLLLLLCVPLIISARHINRPRSRKSQILNFRLITKNLSYINFRIIRYKLHFSYVHDHQWTIIIHTLLSFEKYDYKNIA